MYLISRMSFRIVLWQHWKSRGFTTGTFSGVRNSYEYLPGESSFTVAVSESSPGAVFSPMANSLSSSSSNTLPSSPEQTSSSEADAVFPGADASFSLDVFPSFFLAARSSQYGGETGVEMDRGSVEEAAYTADAKGLRYMSFSAVVKAAVRHLFSNFYSANATSDAEVEGVATCNGGSSLPTGVEVNESCHPKVGTAGITPLQEHYRQVAADALRRQNSATTDHALSPEAQDPAVAVECGKSSANLARRRQSELHCGAVHPETPSLVSLRSSPPSRREFRTCRGKANETNCGWETPPEVFAGVITVEKLAMLDAGVYIRPDLSEILLSRKDAHEVQAMLKRCRDIDAKICELKKRAYLRKPPSDMQSQRRKLSEGDGTGSTRGDGEEVAEVMCNKVRTEGGVKVPDTSCGIAVCSMPCANVFDNTRRTGKLRRPTDAFYAVAASAEIVALRREKLQLHRQLADVRALVEYVWKYGGFSPTSQVNAEQFSRLFCSNEEDLSQQSAAAVLFELCDADNRGSVTFEDLFTRLPLRALEVMFIVTEMEKKGRQAYRYYWI